MKFWEQIMVAVTAGLLGAGLLVVVSSQPRGEPVTLLPLPTPSPILVHVDGAVANPGVYELEAGSRVQDGLEAAGGLLPEAMTAAINFAATLNDGDKVLVPYQPQASESQDQDGSGSDIVQAGEYIDLNTASQNDFEKLPGIGPQKALAIVTYRQEHGAFTQIEQIMNVPGIGPTLFEQIKAYIIIGNTP
jgi:competence protein ComEA